VAVEAGLPVAVFSMEMPGTQLATRFLSSVGRIDQHKIRTGKLNDEEWQRLTYALGKLHEAPILLMRRRASIRPTSGPAAGVCIGSAGGWVDRHRLPAADDFAEGE
jgi:replicative DNA helicase